MTAAELVDIPGSKLPILASKRYVKATLSHLLAFAEPARQTLNQDATEREVRASLKDIPVPEEER